MQGEAELRVDQALDVAGPVQPGHVRELCAEQLVGRAARGYQKAGRTHQHPARQTGKREARFFI